MSEREDLQTSRGGLSDQELANHYFNVGVDPLSSQTREEARSTSKRSSTKLSSTETSKRQKLVGIFVTLVPNHVKIRAPCAQMRELLSNRMLYSDTFTGGPDDLIEEFDTIVNQRFGGQLRGSQFEYMFAPKQSDRHENMALIPRGTTLKQVGRKDIFIHPQQPIQHDLMNHPIVCLKCIEGLGHFSYDTPPPADDGEDRDDDEINTDSDDETVFDVSVNSPRKPKKKLVDYFSLYQHYERDNAEIPINIDRNDVLSLVNTTNSLVVFWEDVDRELLQPLNESLKVRPKRTVNLHRFLDRMTQHARNERLFSPKARIELSFRNEHGAGITKEAYNALMMRAQFETFFEGEFVLIEGNSGRRRFRKAIGDELIVFRQFVVFLIKAFLSGGHGILGLHPAIKGYLLRSTDWEDSLEQVDQLDFADPDVGDMLQKLTGENANEYLTTNFRADFNDLYVEYPQSNNPKDAKIEIAKKELIDNAKSQLDLIRNAFDALCIPAIVNKWPQEKVRMFPDVSDPSIQAVNAMFDYRPERSYIVRGRAITTREVIQMVMERIGTDPDKLLNVVLACTASCELPAPKSVVVTIQNRAPRDADGNAQTFAPVYIATCFRRIELLPGYPVETWVEYLESVFLNPVNAEYNRRQDVARYLFDDALEEEDDDIWIGEDPVPENEDHDQDEVFFEP